MSRPYRVVVAHPEQQHSYHLAAALAGTGELEAYMTTVYCKKGSLTSAVANVLPAKWRSKARSRHCDDLDDDQVVQFCEGEGLLKLFCMNVPAARRWYYPAKLQVADRFSLKVANYAARHEVDAVIGFDGTSPLLFEELAKRAPHVTRIMDMSAANTLYMRHIYERDFELQPRFADKLRQERQIVWDPVRIDRSKREIGASQWFLCGSEFVVRSLQYSGVSNNRCCVCPYGVDVNAFPYRRRGDLQAGRPLSFIYVGGTKELKGIAYLLEAFRKIDSSAAKLIIVGRNDLPQELRSQANTNVTFTGMVAHSEVAELMGKADVMIMPSLGEGFSLTILEAMASGLPVICSENSGAKGIVEEGTEGFFVPIQDADAIGSKVEWFCSHVEALPAMSRAAREKALRYTWRHYDAEVCNAVDQIMRSAAARV